MSDPITQQPVAVIRSMGGLVFDAVFEESHESSLEVTDNPVETGVVISDHAYMLPVKLVIKAGVSDTPLADLSNDPFSSDSGRSRKAFELLTELQRLREPFDVQTGLTLYKNMVCKTIRTSQDKDSDSALVFTAELREVLIASTQIVTYPPRRAGATSRQAGPKKQKGEQQSQEVTDKAKKQSLGKKIMDAIGGKK